jgi:hypothetical protein
MVKHQRLLALLLVSFACSNGPIKAELPSLRDTANASKPGTEVIKTPSLSAPFPSPYEELAEALGRNRANLVSQIIGSIF